jgi:hypothetical protein
VSIRQCREALKKLSAPDPDSRTKERQGRRIEEVDGGWRLLNYLKYRDIRDADERRIQTREAVRRHRAKKADVSNVSHGKPEKAQAEAEAEAEADKSKAFALRAQKVKDTRKLGIPDAYLTLEEQAARRHRDAS